MVAGSNGEGNVKEVVPFLRVSDIERSVRHYVDGLGFKINTRWDVDGRLRWCCLTLGGASLMLQEFPREGRDSWVPADVVGEGVSLFVQCEDALAIYRELRLRGVGSSEPEVGNGMWEFRTLDPDGYRMHFESVTDTPEATKLSDIGTGEAK